MTESMQNCNIFLITLMLNSLDSECLIRYTVDNPLSTLKGGERVGYRIRELRENQGMTQLELAEKSGVSRATLWKLETGDFETTTTQTLGKIADALGVDVTELFCRQNA